MEIFWRTIINRTDAWLSVYLYWRNHDGLGKKLKDSTSWIVIAAYNEGSIIGSVVRNAHIRFTNVVVVDDGSRDDTGAQAHQAGAYVISHPINLGQGAALQTGISFALSKGAQVIITFDADGQHDIADAFSMACRLREGHLDVLLGSRFLGKCVGIPIIRRYFLKLAALFTRFTSGVKVTDAHNGLRALTAESAKKIRIRQNRMAHASEFVDQIGHLKLKVAEHPVSITYSAYSLNKGQRLTNSLAIIVDLFIGKIGK